MVDVPSIFNIWSQRDLGIDVPAAKVPGLASGADIEYVCNSIYPFVQLINANAVLGEEQPINFITASTGWVIHDYGEAMSVSAPHVTTDRGNGSNIADQAKTIEEMAKLIAKKGWTTVEIISGTQAMQRFIWVESRRVKFTLNGYTPSVNDERCYDRLANRAKNLGLAWEHDTIGAKPMLISAAE